MTADLNVLHASRSGTARPGVEVSVRLTAPVTWSANGVSRANAFLVSRDDWDRPVYVGTPSAVAKREKLQP